MTQKHPQTPATPESDPQKAQQEERESEARPVPINHVPASDLSKLAERLKSPASPPENVPVIQPTEIKEIVSPPVKEAANVVQPPTSEQFPQTETGALQGKEPGGAAQPMIPPAQMAGVGQGGLVAEPGTREVESVVVPASDLALGEKGREDQVLSIERSITNAASGDPEEGLTVETLKPLANTFDIEGGDQA